MLTRAEQRRLRLLEIEDEQRLEDAEAIKMTEEQRETLLRSFQSVKFEFNDLDGLSWSDSARQRLRQESQTAVTSATFVVLSNADLASFSPEDTIRVSIRRPRVPRTDAEPPSHSSNSGFLTPALKCRHRDGSRTRSPVKGLFSITDEDTDVEHSSNDKDRYKEAKKVDQPSIRQEQRSVSSPSVSLDKNQSSLVGDSATSSFFRPRVFSSISRGLRLRTFTVHSTPSSSPSLPSQPATPNFVSL
ncbi:hypothetical protein AX17_006847 [Amanita inopinata Kibby_2008]|nr:hypothetical protein AX17_006847 [Amanita inopinata Kibby_2008]